MTDTEWDNKNLKEVNRRETITAEMYKLFPDACNFEELRSAVYEHFSRNDVTPDQMQDGKRYRVTVEGICIDDGAFTSPKLECDGEVLADRFDLQEATRIEEIGGDQ